MIVRPLAALAAATAAFGVAACGGDPSPNASAGDREAQARRAALDYARCMRAHGVDMPDPQFNTDGGGLRITQQGGPGSKVPPERMRAADNACQHIRDRMKPPTLSDAQKEDFRKAALANARCMRAHGIDFPDPQFDANGGARIELGKGRVDPSSPAFQAAQKACSSKLRGGKGPSTTADTP
jgi:hypothetical protein